MLTRPCRVLTVKYAELAAMARSAYCNGQLTKGSKMERPEFSEKTVSIFLIDVLVVHLGGNDLPRVSGKALILDIMHDRKWLNARYPVMWILWSTIIPRLAW